MASVRTILENRFYRKTAVTQTNFSRIKTLYVGLYKQAMLQLYANGLISDPGRWDEDEILNSVYEQGYRTFQTSGRMVLDEVLLLQEVYREDFKEGIHEAYNPDVSPGIDAKNWGTYLSNFETPTYSRMFYIAVHLRNVIQVLDRFYDSIGLRNKSRITIQSRLSYLSGNIKSQPKIPANEATAQVMAGYEAKIVYRSLGKPFQKSLYAFFNVEYPGDGEAPKFISGVSLEQEAELLLKMLDGKYHLDGECGKLAQEWIKEMLWSSGKSNYINSLGQEIRLAMEKEVYLPGFFEAFEGIGEDLEGVLIDSDGAYMRKGENTQAIHMCGQYAYDSMGQELLPTTTTLSGMNGEFIEDISTEEAIDELGVDLEFTGSPVIVHSGEEYVKAYDLDFVGNSEHLNGGKTWFSSIGATLEFGNADVDYLLSTVSTDTVEDCVRSAALLSENGYFGPLIGDHPESSTDYSKVVISVAKELN